MSPKKKLHQPLASKLIGVSIVATSPALKLRALRLDVAKFQENVGRPLEVTPLQGGQSLCTSRRVNTPKIVVTTELYTLFEAWDRQKQTAPGSG